ncbi:hypothetical protein AB4561_10235 [Vibrio sp. 10N.222.55.A3]|nr:hypothetical protein [Vibrio sp. F13]
MDETSLEKLTTKEKLAILQKKIEWIEGHIGDFLALLVNHYP